MTLMIIGLIICALWDGSWIAAACGIISKLLINHVYTTHGISSTLAYWLAILSIILCAVGILFLIIKVILIKVNLWDSDSIIGGLIGVVLCVVLIFQSNKILDAIDQYETYLSNQTRYESTYTNYHGNYLSFGSYNSVQCTQCRGLKYCSGCEGNKIVTNDKIIFECNACEGTGLCKICKGTGRKKY